MVDKKDQYGKDFKYIPPKKEDDEKQLYEKYKRLSDSVLRLDGNMKTMHTDNRTLRKHVVDQQRIINNLNKRVTSLDRELTRVNRLIEMMLKEDDEFKGGKR